MDPGQAEAVSDALKSLQGALQGQLATRGDVREAALQLEETGSPAQRRDLAQVDGDPRARARALARRESLLKL